VVVLPLVLREHLQPGRERNLETPGKGKESLPACSLGFFKKHHLKDHQQFLISKKLAHFFDFRIWAYLELKQGTKLGEQVLIARKKEMISWKKFNIPPTSSLPEKS